VRYTLDGTKILRETWGANTLIPLYDNEDSVCGILYNNIPYYFIKNLQGDIIAIVDKDAKTVARYSYDAWGNHKIYDINNIEVTSSSHIGTINSFRYRSYYYDEETSLYYLQSRYYDASVGRFINADDDEIICLSPHHLYAYAYNTPVNETDSSGKIIQSLLFKIFAGVFCGFFIQLFDDILEYLIQCIVKGRSNAKFHLDLGDYLS